eukprot:5669590-Prymnesium_polylepis.2
MHGARQAAGLPEAARLRLQAGWFWRGVGRDARHVCRRPLGRAGDVRRTRVEMGVFVVCHVLYQWARGFDTTVFARLFFLLALYIVM